MNGPDQVYVERNGKLEETEVRFRDADRGDAHHRPHRLAAGAAGGRSSPMVDARLPDGSRVNAIIPPLSLVGPCISIRKFCQAPLQRRRPGPAGHPDPDMADSWRPAWWPG